MTLEQLPEQFDDEDALLTAATREMQAKINVLLGLERPWTQSSFQKLDELVKVECVRIWNEKGIRVPQLRAVVLRMDRGRTIYTQVHLVRADLEHAGIQSLAFMLARDYAKIGVTGAEIFVAIAEAFPDYVRQARQNMDTAPREKPKVERLH